MFCMTSIAYSVTKIGTVPCLLQIYGHYKDFCLGINVLINQLQSVYKRATAMPDLGIRQTKFV